MTEISETIFIHPFTCLIPGPTSSGKTTIIGKILDQNVDLIKPEINRIIYCYSKWQVGYDILKEKIKSIEFFEGSIFNNQQAFEIPRMKQDLNFQ
jgi:hypothetical protein